MLLCKKLLSYIPLSGLVCLVCFYLFFLLFFFFYFFHKTILNGDENSLVFENLNPDTLYDVSVTAIYPDESESDDLIGSERTCK